MNTVKRVTLKPGCIAMLYRGLSVLRRKSHGAFLGERRLVTVVAYPAVHVWLEHNVFTGTLDGVCNDKSKRVRVVWARFGHIRGLAMQYPFAGVSTFALMSAELS